MNIWSNRTLEKTVCVFTSSYHHPLASPILLLSFHPLLAPPSTLTLRLLILLFSSSSLSSFCFSVFFFIPSLLSCSSQPLPSPTPPPPYSPFVDSTAPFHPLLRPRFAFLFFFYLFISRLLLSVLVFVFPVPAFTPSAAWWLRPIILFPSFAATCHLYLFRWASDRVPPLSRRPRWWKYVN